MSTSKHITAVCIVATLITVLLTILFMNGESLGISVQADETSSTSDYFTDNDLDSDWSTDGATTITLTGDSAEISGNGAYFVDGDLYIAYAGTYILTGELTDGSVIIDAEGDDKIRILMDGVSLTCSDDSALQILQAGKVFLTLSEGSTNTISAENAAFSEEAIAAGRDGAIYSKDDLTINGTGSLTVTTSYKHGIVCNDDFVMTGGTVTIEAAGDGIHANDSVRLTDMTLDITAGDDGITVSNDDETDFLYIASGTVTIAECYEGLEATTITIEGGQIDITCSDDGINARGTDSASGVFINGGSVCINNPSGFDADGIDSNGSIFINGGTVLIDLIGDGTNCPLDYGSENGGILEINGGTVIACGGSGMTESVSSTSAQASIMLFLENASGTETSDDVTGDGTSEEITSASETGSGSMVAADDSEADGTQDSASETGSGNMVAADDSEADETASSETAILLTDSSGNIILSGSSKNGFSSVILSSPELTVGETYTIACGEETYEVTLSDIVTTEGSSQGMGGMGFMGGMPSFQNADSDSEMPSPSDMNSDGEMPSFPEMNSDGEMPSPPEMNSDGEMPSPPDMSSDGETSPFQGTDSDGTMQDRPDFSESDAQDNHAMGPGNPFEEENQADSGFTPDAETWTLVGISVLSLLIGILIAWKSRSKWL